MIRVLVLGSAGMAGHQISLYLLEQGYDVTGFSLNKNPYVDGIIGDATDHVFLKRTIINGNYDYVINCIGILNQYAEQDHANAILINSYLPHYLSKITCKIHTSVIQMSTDCVFSGKRGQYTVTDLKDGESFYDRTKALGELEDEKNTTLRNSIIGPDINENGIGLLNWFMKQHGQINGFTGAIWTGQTTLQLAKTMDYVMKHRVTGLYNAVPTDSITKYELLRLLNHYLRNNDLVIKPVKGVNLNKSLTASPINGKYIIPNYETMIKEMAQWIYLHKELYKHYQL